MNDPGAEPPEMDVSAHYSWVGPTTKVEGGQSHFQAIRLLEDNSVVRIGDNVELLAGEGVEPYVARVEDLWEEAESGSWKVHTRWYYRPGDLPSEYLNRFPYKPLHPQELFLSNSHDDHDVRSIISRAEVIISESPSDVSQHQYLARCLYEPTSSSFRKLVTPSTACLATALESAKRPTSTSNGAADPSTAVNQVTAPMAPTPGADPVWGGAARSSPPTGGSQSRQLPGPLSMSGTPAALRLGSDSAKPALSPQPSSKTTQLAGSWGIDVGQGMGHKPQTSQSQLLRRELAATSYTYPGLAASLQSDVRRYARRTTFLESVRRWYQWWQVRPDVVLREWRAQPDEKSPTAEYWQDYKKIRIDWRERAGIREDHFLLVLQHYMRIDGIYKDTYERSVENIMNRIKMFGNARKRKRKDSVPGPGALTASKPRAKGKSSPTRGAQEMDSDSEGELEQPGPGPMGPIVNPGLLIPLVRGESGFMNNMLGASAALMRPGAMPVHASMAPAAPPAAADVKTEAPPDEKPDSPTTTGSTTSSKAKDGRNRGDDGEAKGKHWWEQEAPVCGVTILYPTSDTHQWSTHNAIEHRIMEIEFEEGSDLRPPKDSLVEFSAKWRPDSHLRYVTGFDAMSGLFSLQGIYEKQEAPRSGRYWYKLIPPSSSPDREGVIYWEPQANSWIIQQPRPGYEPLRIQCTLHGGPTSRKEEQQSSDGRPVVMGCTTLFPPRELLQVYDNDIRTVCAMVWDACFRACPAKVAFTLFIRLCWARESPDYQEIGEVAAKEFDAEKFAIFRLFLALRTEEGEYVFKAHYVALMEWFFNTLPEIPVVVKIYKVYCMMRDDDMPFISLPVSTSHIGLKRHWEILCANNQAGRYCFRFSSQPGHLTVDYTYHEPPSGKTPGHVSVQSYRLKLSRVSFEEVVLQVYMAVDAAQGGSKGQPDDKEQRGWYGANQTTHIMEVTSLRKFVDNWRHKFLTKFVTTDYIERVSLMA